MFEQQRTQQEHQPFHPEEPYDEPWEIYQTYREISEQKKLKCIQFSELIGRVKELNEKTTICTNLSLPWNLMLLQACQFSEQKLISLIDYSKNYLHLISYDPEYIPIQSTERCILCNQTTEIYSNSCGHSACLPCANKYLRQQDTSFKKRQLYPKCFHQSCDQKLNCLFIQLLCHQFGQLMAFYEQLLSFKFMQKSIDLIPCKGFTCNKILQRLQNGKGDLICDCGTRMCQRCKEIDHFPNSCEDVKPSNNPFYQEAQEKNIHLPRFVLHCTDCQVQLLDQEDRKPLKCICGSSYCWTCFNFNAHSFSHQSCFQKSEELQKYRARIKYLQSNRIEVLENRLLNNNSLYVGCSKLVEIRNTVVDIYRFLMNQFVYRYNKRRNCWVIEQQGKFAKQMAERLYESVLSPSVNEQTIIQNLIKKNKINSINFLYARAKEYYKKLRQQPS